MCIPSVCWPKILILKFCFAILDEFFKLGNQWYTAQTFPMDSGWFFRDRISSPSSNSFRWSCMLKLIWKQLLLSKLTHQRKNWLLGKWKITFIGNIMCWFSWLRPTQGRIAEWEYWSCGLFLALLCISLKQTNLILRWIRCTKAQNVKGTKG